MEFLLIVAVTMLWCMLVKARRENQQRVQVLSDLIAALSAQSNLANVTIMANADGYAYWFAGDSLVRAPLVQGEADRGHVETADPTICPDLTSELIDEISGALRQAADDLLRGRGSTLRARAL